MQRVSGLGVPVIKKIFSVFFFACILSSCHFPDSRAIPTEEVSIDGMATSIVQTLEADMTETALTLPSETPVPPTPVPVSTDTPVPAAEMIVNPQEKTPIPTATINGMFPTATLAITLSTGDNAFYQGQSQDNIEVSPGYPFDVTWTFINSGTTTWTEDYAFNYYDGENMIKDGIEINKLTGLVGPLAPAQITVPIVAPYTPGNYLMKLGLTNDQGVVFFITDITVNVTN